MFWLHSCPKCGGDLYEQRDQYGPYIACVQCGHYLSDAEVANLKLVWEGQVSERVETPAKEAVVVEKAA